MYRITLCLLAISLSTSGVQGQANVDESTGIIKTLYVNNQHPSASDANAGTSATAQSARYIRLVQTGNFWADWRIREISAYGCSGGQHLAALPGETIPMELDWQKSNFNIFPNPSLNGQINLSLPAPGHLSVRDITGRMVIPESYREETGIYSPAWKLPAGMYVAVLRSDGRLESVKFVIK